MNTNFDSRASNPVAIILVIVSVFGLGLAFVLGSSVANGDYRKVAMVFGGMVVLWITLGLGRHVWLLIPLCWTLTGKISVLPLPFNVRELAVLACLGIYIMLMVFKKPLKPHRNNTLDFILFLNLGWIVVTFFRNPVGLRFLGGDMVGGRPYFEILIAVIAYWALSRTELTEKMARWMPILMVIGAAGVAFIGTLSTVFPSITPVVAPFYNGLDTAAYLKAEYGGAAVAESFERYGSLKVFGGFLILALISYYRPMSLLTPARPLPFFLFLFAVAAVLLSGFRSALIGSVVAFLGASYFWVGGRDVVRSIFLLFGGLVALMAIHHMGATLPLTAQRALSFLPGEWDQVAVDNAQTSLDWRLEMWETIVKGDFIKDPFLGDGFGFKKEDLDAMLAGSFGGAGIIGASGFENQLITGAYHNGPLSTIRYVGVVGLILFYALMIFSLIRAFQLTQIAKGTPYFPVSLFVGIPLIYGLFSFTFIFGGYDSDFSEYVFLVGVLNLIGDAISQRVGAVRENQVAPHPPLSGYPTKPKEIPV